MIHVIVSSAKGNYFYFKVSGHANFGKHGQDIICAAVSALATTTVNAIATLTPVQPEVKTRDGLLECLVPRENSIECQQTLNTIIGTFLVGIDGMTQQYPKHLKLTREEVASDA